VSYAGTAHFGSNDEAARRCALEASGREAGASGSVAATVETMSEESDTEVTVTT
jgi:carbon monoxide dehydrogenase subunit G